MNEKINAVIGKKIKSRRLIMGMNHLMLATAVNMTEDQIRQYERGEDDLTVVHLVQISQCLGVPVSYFFE